MSTPIEPHDEPIEEPVRQHLWRLRARLVSPPEEARAAADLDRMLEAARLHVHEVPDVLAGPSSEPERVLALEHARARPRPHAVLARTAAAVVVVAAVGSGLAGDRDGGRPAVLAWIAGASAPLVSVAGGVPGTDFPDGTGSAGTEVASDGESEVATGAPTTADEAGAADGGSSRTAGTSGTAREAEERPGATPSASEDGSPADSTATDATRQQPDEGVPASTDPSPPLEGEREVGTDVGEDLIVALPEPDGELDGFGGLVPCPGGASGPWCLPDGAEPVDPVDPEVPVTPTVSTGLETATADTTAADAERR